MLSRSVVWLLLMGAFAAVLLQAAIPAQAAFHCMRIAAVMGGANGDANIQYVELRMNFVGQNFVANHQIRFRNASSPTPVATFTFPDVGGPGVPDVPNSTFGSSILIATAEFAANATVVPDFIFSDGTVIDPNTSMTVPSNMSGMGDLKHPASVGSGKVSFAEGFGNCQLGGPAVVDSVAYGTTYTGTVDYGSKFASDLPTSGTQSLVVSNLNVEPANNATEYSLQTVPFPVPPGANTPRNNAGNTGSIPPPSDSDGDGVPDASDNCPAWPNPSQTLPPWTVPAGDPDCDGFPSTVVAGGRGPEASIGTDPADPCPDNAMDDAWPMDFNMNTMVNIIDVLFFATPILSGQYDSRFDLNANGAVNIIDVLMFGPFIGRSCTNP